MAGVTETGTASAAVPEGRSDEATHAAGLATAVLAGIVLALAAQAGATALLVGVALAQAALIISWTFGIALPGRIGTIVVGGLAAAGADIAVSLFPHGRLGTLLIVFGLAIPVMFVHQLMRGAARFRIVDSLASIALVVLAVVAFTAVIQLRHELADHALGRDVSASVLLIGAGGLALGHLVDLLYDRPRFDPAVSRGPLAVIASTGLGASLGSALIGHHFEFAGGRGALAGAVCGAVVALLAIAASFIVSAPTVPVSRSGRALQPVVGVLLPLAVLAPVAFLLCVALRQ
jgi:hypothetical protein